MEGRRVCLSSRNLYFVFLYSLLLLAPFSNLQLLNQFSNAKALFEPCKLFTGKTITMNATLMFHLTGRHLGSRLCYRKGFRGSRVGYYPNSDASFQLELLKTCGDINPNPGPTKHPCTCCGKPCKSNQRALQCDECNLWSHAKCSYISNNEYSRLSLTDDKWLCNAPFLIFPTHFSPTQRLTQLLIHRTV